MVHYQIEGNATITFKEPIYKYDQHDKSQILQWLATMMTCHFLFQPRMKHFMQQLPWVLRHVLHARSQLQCYILITIVTCDCIPELLQPIRVDLCMGELENHSIKNGKECCACICHINQVLLDFFSPHIIVLHGSAHSANKVTRSVNLSGTNFLPIKAVVWGCSSWAPRCVSYISEVYNSAHLHNADINRSFSPSLSSVIANSP